MEQIMMAPFAKSDMLTELRTILLFEGDHLILGRGFDFAESFLGFAPDDGSNYCDDDPEKVDLSLFEIASSFDRGYDFAYAPTCPIQIGEHEVQDLYVFMEGVPRVGGTSMGGELHAFMTPAGLCRRVADTVFARWKLEIEEVDEFTVRELALLANMSEGAVRNAISNKDLKAFKRGTSTRINHKDTHRWLLGRQGFVAMPPPAESETIAVTGLLQARTPGDFGASLQSVLSDRGHSIEETGAQFGWSEADRRRWLDGDITSVFSDVIGLARLLEIDEADLLETLMRLGRHPPS